MSAFLNELQQPEYVHVLINHLPLTGLFAALLALVGALVVGNRAALFIALTLVGLFALAAWPVSEYGEAAYDRVLSMSDDAGAAYLARHRELAQRWVFMFYVTAGAAALATMVGEVAKVLSCGRFSRSRVGRRQPSGGRRDRRLRRQDPPP
jgi:hypothetical protein